MATDRYVLNGTEFTVRATDARFMELVREHFASFRVDVVDDDPPNIFSVDCGEEKLLPGGRAVRPVRRMYLGSLKIFKGPSIEEMFGRFVGSVRDLVTAHADEFVRLRAGGVVFEDRTVLLPSAPTPHLSALTGLLARYGGEFLGDEMCNLDPILGRIFGLPFPLLIDSQDANLFPDLEFERGGRRPKGSPEHVQGRTPRRAVSPVQLGSRFGRDAAIGRIVVPHFDFNAPTSIAPLPGAEAVFRLTQSVLNLHIWGDRALVLLRRIVDEHSVEQLVVGSIADAAQLVLETAPAEMSGG